MLGLIAGVGSTSSFGLELLLPTPISSIGQNSIAERLPAGHHAMRFNPSALSMKAGQEIMLTLTQDKKHTVIFDRTESHPNGDVSWIGHIKSQGGNNNRVIITRGRNYVSGQIRTPETTLQLRMANAKERLIDPIAAGMKTAPFDIEPARSPIRPTTRNRQKTPTSEAQMLGGQNIVDLAVLYPPQLVTKLGSVAAVQSHINHLLTVTNQAYLDSEVEITLRLVLAQQVDYSSTRSMYDLLNAISASENPDYLAAPDPKLAHVKSLRNSYAADLVSLLVPFDNVAHGGTCGLAWMGGEAGGNINNDASYAYSVIGNGSDVGGSGYYCDELTLAHELGHNMGSAHDAAHAGTQGAYPYSYGYGRSSVFGTIMSYINPTIARFSNPRLSCNGSVCGLSNSADNARSLNNTRGAVSNFRAQALQTQSQSGWWWNALEPGRGYFIETKNNKVFMGSFLYRDDGYPIWYVSSAASNQDSSFSASLTKHTGGQTLTGAYTTPLEVGSDGAISLSFSSSTQGTMTWPGGSIPLVRYEIASGSLSASAPAFQPETGWWWNANEGGRGFSIEVQGEHVFIAGFMYDSGGNPVWYVSGGKMSTQSFYQGSWQQCLGGQSMMGVFRTATCSDLQTGSIAINFSSPTTASLQLPDGRILNLTRFSF